MEEWLHEIAHFVSLAIEAGAILVIAAGSIDAFVRMVPFAFNNLSGPERRAVWLRYAQWLNAGLTFQLAADVVNTTITPNWEQIGHVAAIAAIRTFLTFFLDKDMSNIRDALKESPHPH